MLQSLDKQTDKCSLLNGLTECHYQKSSIEIFKLTKVPSLLKEESVGWNWSKRMLVKSITSARSMD